METSRKSLVAATGASGHVGGNLVRALLDEGRRVRVLVREDTRAVDGLDVERVQGDLLDAASLTGLVDGADVVYHLGAVITLKARRDAHAHEVNVEGTRNVVAACQAAGVRRLMHFSSIHAFSERPEDNVIDESRDRCNDPRAMAYDRSKADGERAVLEGIERGLDAVIVNPTAIIGPHDYKPSAVGRVLLDLHLRRLPSLVNGGFNWVDVRDVCAGAMAAERLGKTGERYLLAGTYLTLRELAALVEEVTGAKSPALSVPIWMARLGVPFAAFHSWVTGAPPRYTRASLHALEHHQRISHDKAARELGYAPRPIRETLEDTFAWFKEAGYL